MPKKNRWKLFLILFFLGTSSRCATKPPDVAVFEHLNQKLSTDPVSGHLILEPSPECMEKIQEVECGHGVFIMSGKEIFVGENKKTWFKSKPWSQLRAESILVPAEESYAPLSNYMINSCKKLKCDDDVEKFRTRTKKLKNTEKQK